MRACVILSPIVVICVFLLLVDGAWSYEWRFSSCIVQVYEPCPMDGAVRFYLRSSGNSAPLLLDPHNPKLPETLNANSTLKILIHGYGGDLDTTFPHIAQGYLQAQGYHVIEVNWKELSDLPCYPAAVVNTWQAGRCSAVLLASLAAQGFQPKAMHLVGFSLGAHVASITSNLLHDAMSERVGRITGLDPALPLYATLSLKPEWKLDFNDADFVDIIHTNAGLYGKVESTGHVDFYLNGGSAQPACDDDPSSRLCSHLMAPLYFTESISSEVGFWGDFYPSYFHYVFGWYTPTNDDSQALMGEHCPTSSRGVYFVVTHHSPPYAVGTY